MENSLRLMCMTALSALFIAGCGSEEGDVPASAEIPAEVEEQRPDDTTDDWEGWEQVSCDLVKANGPFVLMFGWTSGTQIRRCGWFTSADTELVEFVGTCEDESHEPGFVLCRGFSYDTEHGTGNMAGHAWIFEKK